MTRQKIDLLMLRKAIESSWEPDTAYHKAEEVGNPALGQCYVTSRVIQHYFPEAEVVQGEVLANGISEKHFWNIFRAQEVDVHVDFTWSQFPAGSKVTTWAIRDRETYNDSPPTVERVETLLKRVRQALAMNTGE